MEQYGERIKIARTRAGLTQEQLGKAIGISGVSVMRYEKGVRTPSTEMLMEIAKALQCNFLFLLGVSDYITEEEQDEHNDNPDEAKKAFESFYDDILFLFNKLNYIGIQEAIKRIWELTEIPKYQDNSDQG